jgi:hypothetical protein
VLIKEVGTCDRLDKKWFGGGSWKRVGSPQACERTTHQVN